MLENRELIQVIRAVDEASAAHALNGRERLQVTEEGVWVKELLIDSGGAKTKKWARITIEVREEG